MILTDTGPLVALLDPKQDFYAECLEVLRENPAGLLTMWPCATEVMYFANAYGGFHYQSRFFRFIQCGLLQVFEPQDYVAPADPSGAFMSRISALMDQYKDLPMDFADASLVAASESLRTRTIFTLDRKDFSIYRAFDGGAFEIVP